MNYRVFYKSNGQTYSLEEHSNDLIEEDDNERDLNNFRYFESMKGYETTHESLIKFRDDFSLWIKELKKYKIDYVQYFSHLHATYYTFLKYATNDLRTSIQDGIDTGLDGIENINFVEFRYYEKCFNAGLMSIDETIINIENDFHGYDFSSYYPHLLSKTNLQMPIKAGKQSKITDFKKKLKYGIYEIKISCDDKNFKKIFAFSKDNSYTHYSVNFCLKYKKKFNIILEIINIDKEFNCLVYDDKDLILTSNIFNNWFNKLYEIKIKFPKNKLIKHLMTNIWGALIQFNRIILKTDEEYYDCDISDIDSPDNTEFKLLEIDNFVKNGEIFYNYKVIKSDKPYKHHFRIKPFLTSFGRKMMGDFVIEENLLDDLVRVQTDGLVLTSPKDFDHLPYYPKPEDKTTGQYTWYSVNTNSRNFTK